MSNALNGRPSSARRRGLWGGGASTSSQRPLWSKDEEWPTETALPERTETVPPGAQPLSRYMRKRHGVLDWNLERKAEFATRYVHVDDMNGRIYYTGNPNLKEKVALSLGEVASVRALPKAEAGATIAESWSAMLTFQVVRASIQCLLVRTTRRSGCLRDTASAASAAGCAREDGLAASGAMDRQLRR